MKRAFIALLALGFSAEAGAQGPNPCLWPGVDCTAPLACRVHSDPLLDGNNWPISGGVQADKINDAFGPRWKETRRDNQSPTYITWDYHEGIDIRARTPLAVRAPWRGVVHHINDPCTLNGADPVACATKNHFVVLRHEAPDHSVWYTGYHHLRRDPDFLVLQRGTVVEAGAQFVNSGETGAPGSPHLHFATMVGDWTPLEHAVNPMRMNSLPYDHTEHPAPRIFGFWYRGVNQVESLSFYVDSKADPTEADTCPGGCRDELHFNRVRVRTPSLGDEIVVDFDRRKNDDTKVVGGGGPGVVGNEDGYVQTRTSQGHPTEVFIVPFNFLGSYSEVKRIEFTITVPGPWKKGDYTDEIEVTVCDTWAYAENADCPQHCVTVPTRVACPIAPQGQAGAQTQASSCKPLMIVDPPSTSPPAKIERNGTMRVAVFEDLTDASVVDLLVDGAVVRDDDGRRPWYFSWTPSRTNSLEGPHALQARATMKAGGYEYSDPVNVDVVADTTGPAVDFVNLRGGFRFVAGLESIKVEVLAKDPDGFGLFALDVRNRDDGTGPPTLVPAPGSCRANGDTQVCPFFWPRADQKKGSYRLTATVGDARGNRTQESVDVMLVADASPLVAWANLAPGQVLPPAYKVLVSASHPLGAEQIEKVVLRVTSGNTGQTVVMERKTPATDELYAFDWIAASGGRHVFEAYAIVKAGGNTHWAPTLEASVQDATLPTVVLRGLFPGAPVDHRVPVEVDSTDDLALARVELRDGVQTLTDTSVRGKSQAHSLFKWCPAPVGPNTLQAAAIDGAGNQALSQPPVPVTLAGRRCLSDAAIAIQSPGHGQTVKDTVTVGILAVSGATVTNVEFAVDGVTKASGPSLTWAWDTKTATNGRHRITVSAQTSRGLDTESVDVNVANPVIAPPLIKAVQLGHFAHGSPIGDRVVVTVEAVADVAHGRKMQGVEFLVDGRLEAERLGGAGTYRWTWDTALWERGAHTLRVVARDDGGLTSSSDNAVTLATILGPTVTYEAASNGWCRVKGALFSPGARSSPTMVYVPGGWLLYGGSVQNRASDELWTFDGLAWNDITNPDRRPGTDWPRPARKVIMVYDENRGRVVLGGDAPYLWEWDLGSKTWSRHPVGLEFDSRDYSDWSMAYDRGLRRVVIHGSGINYQDYRSWEWDGATLSAYGGARNGDYPFRPRYAYERMYYHDPTGLHLLSNRANIDNEEKNFHWRRDGKNWDEKLMENWPYLNGLALAYNPRVQYTYALVGDQFKYLQYKSYFWLRSSYPPPFVRWYHAMAFDGDGQMLLAGGGGASGLVDDSWTFKAGRPTCPVAQYTFDTVNDPIRIAAIAMKTVTPGQDLSFEVVATDPEGDPIRLAGESLPDDAQFPPASGAGRAVGTFRWHVPDLPPGLSRLDVEALFVATDPWGNPARQEALIRICRKPNDCDPPPIPGHPPVIPALPDQQVLVGQAIGFTVVATDEEDDPIVLSASGLPAGAKFVIEESYRGYARGRFSWTPSSPAVVTVTFRAGDDDGTTTRPVRITVRGPDAPDLTVTAFGWPALGDEGALVNFTYMVKNEGALSAPGGYLNRLEVDGVPVPNAGSQVGSRPGPALAPGGSDTNGFAWRATCGLHTIRVRTDAVAQVGEGNEANNLTPPHTINIRCLNPVPDLVVESLIVDPAVPAVTSLPRFIAVVKNVGTAAAGPSRTRLRIDENSDGTWDLTDATIMDTGPLAAGASETEVWFDDWVAAIGQHLVEACSDVGQSVAEGGTEAEGNNCTLITVVPKRN